MLCPACRVTILYLFGRMTILYLFCRMTILFLFVARQSFSFLVAWQSFSFLSHDNPFPFCRMTILFQGQNYETLRNEFESKSLDISIPLLYFAPLHWYNHYFVMSFISWLWSSKSAHIKWFFFSMRFLQSHLKINRFTFFTKKITGFQSTFV